MSTDHAAVHDPPISLVLLGGLELIGFTEELDDGRERVSPAYVLLGGLEISSPDEAGEVHSGVTRAVRPLSGVVTRRELVVRPLSVTRLSSLAPTEAREIMREYTLCDQVCANGRAQYSGVLKPQPPSRLVLPGRAQR